MTVKDVKNITLPELIALGEFKCQCGKVHSPGVGKVIIESGAVNSLPGLICDLNCSKPFILSGHDTFAAAGDVVCTVLHQAGINYESYVFPVSPVKPTEQTVGSAVMHFDYSCDCIVAVGSGVINDTSKILSKATGRKYIIVGTAPSMDGFVSGTSSMDRDDLKTSIYSSPPWAVIGDIDIMRHAPMHMLRSGVGDMLAKIVSLREWQIANILVDEDYCPVIAGLVEKALNKVITSSAGLLSREPDAVKSVMEGLIIAGIGMNYAGVSRPASGMEHYFSHIWDMRSLAFEDAQSEQHGIQAGIGTLYTLRMYEYIRNIIPDREKALSFVEGFSLDDWNKQLTEFVGPAAQAMIEGENREHKYSPEKHRLRLERIIENWDKIIAIIDTLPPSSKIEELMDSLGMPTGAEAIGYTPEQIRKTFTMTKDIRDKYVGTRLLWDLGELDAAAEALF